uniref:type II toxin-antitoxin system TacA family antitoxin n=1 Tax=Photorhabdus sp. RM322S TaxID=3342825 RepID=UPI0036DDA0DC
MTSHAERKEARLVARISTEIQEIIQRAADYSGTTISQFLIESAMEKARNVIERTETLHLSMAGADALFAALENPPKANNKLLKAAQHYKETVNVNNP